MMMMNNKAANNVVGPGSIPGWIVTIARVGSVRRSETPKKKNKKYVFCFFFF